jgi:hypothetical protein
MHPVLLKVQVYLDQVNRGVAVMPPHVLDEAAKQFRRAMDRQFNRSGPRDFRLRMSNIGMPLCQLWHEKNGTPAEPGAAFFRMKMALGDAAEIIAIAIMQAAGVNIVGYNEKAEITVSLPDGEEAQVFGRTDIAIDEGMGPEIYDIKSASAFAFENKFDNPFGYDNLLKQDDFGYLCQAFGYEIGTGTRFAGWIAVNKETGDWTVLQVPDQGREEQKAKALTRIKDTVKVIESNGGFPGRQFEPVEETFRGKPTGNLILGKTCGWCPYKWHCWPTLTQEPQRNSVAKNPKMVYYVASSTEDRG